METGICLRLKESRKGGLCGALLLYLALWGGVLKMAGQSGLLLLLLLPGCAVVCAALLPGRWSRIGLAAACVLCLALLVGNRRISADGLCILLNRLCESSQAQQSYTYEMLPVSAPGLMWDLCLWYALVPLGLLSGALCGAAVLLGTVWIPLILLMAFSGAKAYLGVYPGTPWLCLLCLAMVLLLRERSGVPGKEETVAVLAAALVLWTGAVLLLPGESSALSSWEERARDTLALHTVAFQQEEVLVTGTEPQQQETETPVMEEETTGTIGGDVVSWPSPPSAFWVILLLALALFLPSAASDWVRKRRERNRAGLDDPDPGTAVRCMFLYGMRWLRLGGLTQTNELFGTRAEEIERRFSPELRRQFEAVLPLWQEAVYSDHGIGEDARVQMQAFLDEAKRMTWAALDCRARFRTRFIDAL